MLERAEIIYGPSSVIYGSDALGGVIHYITRDPELSDSAGKLKFGLNAYTQAASGVNSFNLASMYKCPPFSTFKVAINANNNND